jgi:hypothetical protein
LRENRYTALPALIVGHVRPVLISLAFLLLAVVEVVFIDLLELVLAEVVV